MYAPIRGDPSRVDRYSGGLENLPAMSIEQGNIFRFGPSLTETTNVIERLV
jgi:hypothetical protein